MKNQFCIIQKWRIDLGSFQTLVTKQLVVIRPYYFLFIMPKNLEEIGNKKWKKVNDFF